MPQNRHANHAAESVESDTTHQPAGSLGPPPESGTTLLSLAPEYRDEHATYVRHLEAAVKCRKNKNIALTGRYGSGKSSILDHFLKDQKNALRISINTLGPDDTEHLTNRIQKELVKQLIYRAKPGKIRHTRIARRKEPTKTRALLEGAGIGAVLAGLLWLLGIRPNISPTGADLPALSFVLFFLLVVSGASAVRYAIGDRLISQFSTAGTSISLDKKSESYFDEYLNEIVAFFAKTKPDLVVFEDLDRFDNPQIFDSLRELNTLINASTHWAKRKKRPLRFVYAIKDSLFEKLHEKPLEDPAPDSNPVKEESPRDAAEVAVERAERTKFFEVVIPVVPFISHSNARDLLSNEMEAVTSSEGTAVGRGLIDIVAQHATDMRLLRNIRNEFVVFAEKLLWIDKEHRAPGLDTDTLFALVVYKNFHLADFETLPQRCSVLDKLELARQEIVNAAIAELHKEEQAYQSEHELQSKQEQTARNLGDRLTKWATTMNHRIDGASVGQQRYGANAINTPTFWKQVAETGTVQLTLGPQPGSSSRPRPSLTRDLLNEFFPEAMDPHRWEPRDDGLARKIDRNDREIADLRGADFADLAKLDRVKESFTEAVNTILPSRLARDLVLNGYLNRYYAEYSAVFYGDFLGVDVANFFRNCVWPNKMDETRTLTTEDVQNVLDQAPEHFTRSRSALNTSVVNHLLKHESPKAKEVVDLLITGPSEDRTAFLEAFLRDKSSRREELVGHLAAHPWSELFTHLASSETIADEATRAELADAALRHASDAEVYELDDEARALIIDHHAEFRAFTDDLGTEHTEVVVEFADRIGLNVPSLQPLSAKLRRRIVQERRYALTADNLRLAVGLSRDEPITLDRIREDEDVWRRCYEDITGYLTAATGDKHTEHTVLSPEVLSKVVDEQHESWTDEQLDDVLKWSAPDASLPNITDVSSASWPAIVWAHRVEPSAANILAAYTSGQNLDAALASILELVDELWHVDQLDSEGSYRLALQMLTSPSLNAARAVKFTEQLSPDHEVEVSDLKPGNNDLLACLLEAELVPDDRATFAHFIGAAGWQAVSWASVVSNKITEFVNPELVSTVVADLLEDEQAPDALKKIVVTHLDQYVTDDGDHRALRAAGLFARVAELQLSLEQIERIARANPSPEDIVWQLATVKPEPDDIMRLLAELGGEYSGFDRPGHKFKVPTSREMARVLDHLEKRGRVKTGTARHGRRQVQVVT